MDRHDVLLRRGVTTEWGIRWETTPDGGRTYAPVAWAGWAGTLTLRSVRGEEWVTLPVSLEPGGLCRVTVPAVALTGAVWAGRAHGTWAVVLTGPAGRVERLAGGIFYLEA